MERAQLWGLNEIWDLTTERVEKDSGVNFSEYVVFRGALVSPVSRMPADILYIDMAEIQCLQ